MEGRRRRNETSISIRKSKKNEGLAKRRAMAVAPASTTPEVAASNVAMEGTSAESKVYTVADIPTLKARLSQPQVDDATLLECARGFRKILSVEHNPPVYEVLESGILPAFIQMLQLNDKPKVQFEAAWALTNIASTEETKAIVDAGAVPHMAQLLSSPSAELREQCAWCLGNIAGDSAALRDVVLNSGALQPLLQNIEQPANNSLFCNCVWACSNFCRGKPIPNISQVAPAVPVMANILRGTNDEAKQDALWCLSYISDGTDDNIQTVLNTGIVGTIVGMLSDESNVVTPALRTVGNIVSGNDDQTQAIIDADLMSHMKYLLNHPKRMVRKEACWVLSNIAAGTHKQISAVIKTKGCCVRVTEMATSAEWEVRKEAIWVISNIATGGTDGQIMSIIEAGAIDSVCSILDINDTKMLLVALDAVDNILKLGVKLNKDYTSFVDECDGLEMIENLQEHESEKVYEKAVNIIETYFGAEDDGEDENLAPEINGGTFSFGVNKTVTEANPAHSNAQPFTTFNFAS